MRLRHSEKPLPTNFANHPQAKGIVTETDVRIARSRLMAKVIVFHNRKHLREFWKRVLGLDLGSKCDGAVNALIFTEQTYEGGKLTAEYLVADKRYFCVIGLLREQHNMEVISHEAVHAGFCYAKRVRRTPWNAQVKHFEEEAIAYPAGEVAAAINRIYYRLQDEKSYQ
jgi:hypothetical protein